MTHLHGPVPLDDPAYAQRAFETKLIKDLLAGHWVLLLGPRQHGKTSALIRLREKLGESGISAVLVDLQMAPPFEKFEQLVGWFADKVASGFGVAPPNASINDLALALEHSLPEGNSSLLVLIDEASSIHNIEWRNSFFGQIRAISNERATAPDGHMAKRLRFAFSGTFRPERLVAEANSPFNVCERVDTTDLNLDDVKALATEGGLQNVEGVSDAVVAAVSGHPYLVQRLIYSAQGMDDELEAVGRAVSELKLGTSDHITNLFSRVLEEESLIEIVSEVVREGEIAIAAGNHDQRYLTVLGLLTANGNKLVFRNPLYADIAANTAVFTGALAAQDVPKVVLFELPVERFAQFGSAELREIARSAQGGAVAAYRAGSNRLALAGFGAALETVLLDFLLRQSSGDIAKAGAKCLNRNPYFFDATKPGTWTLADMMRGTRELTAINDVPIPEPLREWRNMIHPSVALQNYKSDGELVPEVCTAFGLFDMLLRDLP